MRRTILMAALIVLMFPVAVLTAQGTSTAFPLASLLAGLGPIVSPLLASGVVYLLNKRTTLMANWPNWAKAGAYVVFGTVGGYITTRTGLDLSSTAAFATSLISTLSGLALFHVGKASPPAKA